MTIEQYWIGKGIDVEEVWSDFENGSGYKNKFGQMECHLIEIAFENPNSQPLFNHEAIYKTIKYLFHETKRSYFNDQAYNNFGPLFLYQVRRSSGIYQFLGELIPGCVFLIWLANGALDVLKKVEELKGTKLDNKLKEQILSLVRDKQRDGVHLDGVHLERMRKKLLSQNLKKVAISKAPFKATEKTKEKIGFKVKK